MESKEKECINSLIALSSKFIGYKKEWKSLCWQEVLSLLCLYAEYYQSSVLEERIIKEWEVSPVTERNWYYQQVQVLFPSTVKVLVERSRTLEAYQTMKDLTGHLTLKNAWLMNLDWGFKYFVNFLSVEKLYAHAKIMFTIETYTSVKRDNFLSALILMVYLKLEKKLDATEEQRLLKLSMLRIDRFPYQLKEKLRNSLILRCHIVQEWRTKKKRWIMMKREGYASGKMEKWEEKVKKRMRNCHRLVRNAF